MARRCFPSLVDRGQPVLFMDLKGRYVIALRTGTVFFRYFIRSKPMRSTQVLLFLVVPLCSLGQGEDNNWFFGTSNLLFGNGNPVSIPTTSNMNAREGSASISDANGQLLFYTDGIEAWNRDYQLFPTWPSTSFPQYILGGNQSSAQAALIVPKPASSRYYYVFTVAESGFGYGPARYSVVDMTLDGGKGDILPCAAARLWVDGPLLAIGDTSFHEKLTAVRHANGRDVWVIAHRWESNEFWVVPVTPCGVDTANVVVSAVGTFVGGFYNFPTCNDRGMLVASPQGDRLAMCNEGPAGEASLDLYDFDPATGIVSNPILLPSPFPPYQGETWCYGASFSPNGQLLYVSSWYHAPLLQFDVTLPTAALIQASVVTVGTTAFQTGPDRGFGHLRLGPDGRLYASIWNTDRLAIVPDPDNPGIGCGFLDGAIQCQPSAIPVIEGIQTTTQRGLPAPVLPSRPLFLPVADTLITCAGTPLTFTLPPGLDGLCLGFAAWAFDDPGSGPLNSSFDETTTHIYAEPGIYIAYILVDQECEQDSLAVPVRVFVDSLTIPTQPSVSICPGDSVLLEITGLPDGASVSWSNGTVSDTLSVGEVGVYTFIVNLGCALNSGSITVLEIGPPPEFSIADTVLCNGTSISFQLPAAVDTLDHTWSDGSTGSLFTVADTGLYFLEVSGPCGAVRDTFLVLQADDPFVRIPASFNLCQDAVVQLSPESIVGSLLWSLTQGPSPIVVDRAGWYGYTVSAACGSITDSVRVDNVICDSSLVCTSFYVPNAFTPDNDGINDRFAPVWDAVCRTTLELLLFDRWGGLIHTWRSGDPAWDGTYNNVPCPIGIYAYLVTASFANGEERRRTGHVALVR